MPGRVELDPVEQRVLGALLEKQRTVPDSYPLSLNSLRTACNQTTSRDPVVSYDEPTVVDALNRLRDRELVRFLKPAGLRVVKYHQRLEEQLGLDEERTALLTVLLLRGPQTPGELLPRVERILAFADRQGVEEVLREMAALDPPLVRELDRAVGQRDRRWAHLLGTGPEPAAPAPSVDREQVLAAGAAARDRLVATEYDRLAGSYAVALGDDLDAKPFDRWLLDRLAGWAEGEQGLDVGCGPAQVAGYLAGRGVAMTGLDLSANMLARARELHPEVQVVRGSFAVPPMPRDADPRDPGWAVVSAWYAFAHLAASELAPTLAALTRVLRRGGRLALAAQVGDEVRHPGVLWDVATELDFVLHDAAGLIAAAQAAGLVELEWYRRGALPQETPVECLYLLGRRDG
ncbi:DUF480 domain-containing protein [Intrasporangium sp.]|uniref:DUF480 domain-containing protein n=1 Tax=Intrasporangium sp. TaxID=1925024 RepID=UPI003221C2C3